MIDDLHVLVPDRFGQLEVCSISMLLDALVDATAAADDGIDGMDEDTFQTEVLDNAAMDMIERRGDVWAAVEKVRELNRTGDARHYWGFDAPKEETP